MCKVGFLISPCFVSDGITIFDRNLSYTYPGCFEPALKNINFSLEAGETLAIVGYNGSGTSYFITSYNTSSHRSISTGKSTLAKLMLRIVDYDRGSLLVNGVDIRRYNPTEYHSHLSAVFQGFSKFSTTVKENVGLGNVEKIGYKPAIETAVHLAEADTLVKSLPNGLKTMLETPGYESLSYPGMMAHEDTTQRHGLSGGEVRDAMFCHLVLAETYTHHVLVATYCPGKGLHASK